MTSKVTFSKFEGELSFTPGFLRGGSRSLVAEATGRMWPQRSEEVLEALNWEKREISQDFLAPESPEALAAIQFTEIRRPHPPTEI